jgi:hypothetical protein
MRHLLWDKGDNKKQIFRPNMEQKKNYSTIKTMDGTKFEDYN